MGNAHVEGTQETNDDATDRGDVTTGTSEVFLSNPREVEDDAKVPLGVKVTSIQNLDESERHILKDVVTDSPAEQIGFRNGEEVLVLQDVVLFDKNHESVIGVLTTMCIDKEFSLFTRRSKSNRPETDIEYELFDTKATVSLTGVAGSLGNPEVLQHQRISKHDGDIIFVKQSQAQKIFMEVEDQMYLKVIDGEFKVTRGLSTDDPTYLVEMLHFPSYTVTSQHLPQPLTTPAVVLRHHPLVANEANAKYLSISEGIRPVLEERYVGIPAGPEVLNNADHDVIFLFHHLGAYGFALELFSRRGTYLAARGNDPKLFLTEVEGESDRRHNPYIRFRLLRPTAPDAS